VSIAPLKKKREDNMVKPLHRKPINKCGHFCAKQPGFGGRRKAVHKDWDERPFKRNMSIVTFLKLLVQEPYKDIIINEASSNPRQGSTSALSMLEYCYADDTDECSTFTMCILDVLHTRFTANNYKKIYKLLAVLKTYLFPASSSKPNSEAQWCTKVNNTLRDAQFHEDDPIEDREDFMEFDEAKLMTLSNERKQQRKKRAEENLSTASANPTVVPEHLILKNVAAIKDIIASNEQNTTDVRDAKALLLLLCCGSRPFGMFTQRFSKFENDLPTIPKMGEDTPTNDFMVSQKNLIAVTRVAKEGSKAKRAVKQKKKRKQTLAERKRIAKLNEKFAKSGKEEVEDDSDNKDDDEEDDDVAVSTEEIMDKVVVLPLLPFVSRDEFFTYLQDIRTADSTKELLQLYGLPADVDNWTDALVRGESRDALGLKEFVKDFFTGTNQMVKKLFKGYNKKRGGKNAKGASFLRPLYGQYAFQLFGTRRYHNLAFLQKVLGHTSDITSRNYQWLKVDMMVRAEESLNAQTSVQLARMRAELDRCCSDTNRGVKRRRDGEHKYSEEEKGGEHKYAEEEKGEAQASSPSAQPAPTTLISLPKKGGGLVTVTKPKFVRVRRKKDEAALTKEEKSNVQLEKFERWINQVAVPAGVDLSQLNGGYAKLIGVRKTTIQRYRKKYFPNNKNNKKQRK